MIKRNIGHFVKIQLLKCVFIKLDPFKNGTSQPYLGILSYCFERGYTFNPKLLQAPSEVTLFLRKWGANLTSV